jgi:HAD superfamily hydrolase (TIGR01509 family)
VRIEVAPHVMGLVFDCDGTLVDSMPLHMEAWEHALHRHGGTYDLDFFMDKRGMHEEAIIALHNAHFGEALDSRRVVAAKHAHFRRHLHTLAPVAVVAEVAHRHAGALPMAVVSGGAREIVARELEVAGLDGLFAAIVTADDPVAPKPAPDGFLAAARLLAVPPELCQAFEDGDLGLRAAAAAGMLATDVRPYLIG